MRESVCGEGTVTILDRQGFSMCGERRDIWVSPALPCNQMPLSLSLFLSLSLSLFLSLSPSLPLFSSLGPKPTFACRTRTSTFPLADPIQSSTKSLGLVPRSLRDRLAWSCRTCGKGDDVQDLVVRRRTAQPATHPETGRSVAPGG